MAFLKQSKRAAIASLVMVLLLALAGVSGLVLNLDRLARRAVETHTTAALNLATTVQSVSVHAMRSQVDFLDFRIASPPGFNEPQMLQVPSALVNVACSELRNEPVHIHSITLHAPRLVIESDSAGLNLKRMIDNLPHSHHPVHLVIEQVTVENATVVLRNVPGVVGELSIPVEPFTVTALGTEKPEGILIKDALIRVVTALAVHASDSDRMPIQYRILITGDIGQAVKYALPHPMAHVFTGLLGGRDPAPAPKR